MTHKCFNYIFQMFAYTMTKDCTYILLYVYTVYNI